jgi:hypothetical protein
MLDFNQELVKKETIQIIAQLESNNGKYINHKSSAMGIYGIKPSTARELGFEISDKNQKIVAEFLYEDICTKLRTKDPNIVVYAWLKGIYGAKKQINKPIPYRSILTHWHVEKYRKKLTDYDKFIIDTNLIYSKFSSKSI